MNFADVTAEGLYFIFSVGLLVGFLVDLIMGGRGMSTIGNLVNGVIGALLVGGIALGFGLAGYLVYAALGTLLYLFIINVFSVHGEESSESGTASAH